MANLYPTKSIERKYETQLKKVARIVGGIVDTYTVGDTIINQNALNNALDLYAQALEPWAAEVVAKVIQNVDNNNRRAFNSHAEDMSVELRRILNETETGSVARLLQDEQVELITSLPLEAGIRAQEIARNAATGGIRATEAAKEIRKTGQVTESRAVLIARTEIAKSNAAFTQARSQSIGSTSYIWRTAEDSDVRATHAHLEGTIHEYSNPPFIEGEGNHGPGEIWNCRCWAEPIITI
jgi:SPP1 gp7 family putative phage head morphogenesis protein